MPNPSKPNYCRQIMRRRPVVWLFPRSRRRSRFIEDAWPIVLPARLPGVDVPPSRLIFIFFASSCMPTPIREALVILGGECGFAHRERPDDKGAAAEAL